MRTRADQTKRLLALIAEIKRQPAQTPETLYARLGCRRSQFFEDRNPVLAKTDAGALKVARYHHYNGSNF